jgi:hypothetical protein
MAGLSGCEPQVDMGLFSPIRLWSGATLAFNILEDCKDDLLLVVCQ